MTNAERSPTFYEFDSTRAVPGLARDGRPGRGTRRHLPLAHRHRGLPVADRHLLRQRARGALRAGFDPGPDGPGVPLVPDPRRRGHRGARVTWWNDPGPRPGWTPKASTQVHQRSIAHGHRGSHPDDPAHLHRRRQAGRGNRRHARRAAHRPGRNARRPARAAGGRRGAAPFRQRVPERRGRPLPRRAGDPGQGRRHGHRPARGGRRRAVARDFSERTGHMRYDSCSTPSAIRRWSACPGCRPSRRRAAVGQARGPQPDRLGQGPRRRSSWSSRPRRTGCSRPGSTILEPTCGNTGISLAMVAKLARLPADLRDAGEHLRGAPPAAADVRAPRSSPPRPRAAPTRRSGWRSGWPPSTPTG